MVDTNCARTSAQAEDGGRRDGAVQAGLRRGADLSSARTSTLSRSCEKASGVPLGVGENATSLVDLRDMVTIGLADSVQPAVVEIGLTGIARVAAEVEKARRLRACRTRSISGPGSLAALRCVAAKEEKKSPLERMFC